MLIVWAVVAVVLAVLLAAVVIGVLVVRRSWPRTGGTLRLAGLDAPVEVLRDGHGVPSTRRRWRRWRRTRTG